MGLLDWLDALGLHNFLTYFGLTSKKAKLMLLGLDNAGKSTLLGRLKGDLLRTMPPTQYPHSEELVIGRVSFTAFDVGGHEIARRVWKDYFPGVSCVIFVVDAHDHERFEEAKKELNGLLTCDELQGVPFLILGNKIDMGRTVSELELRAALGLHGEVTGKDVKSLRELNGRRPLELFMCSVVKRSGYGEGIRWISSFL